MQVVRAFSKEKLLFRAESVAETTLNIDGDVAAMGKSSAPQTLDIGVRKLVVPAQI